MPKIFLLKTQEMPSSKSIPKLLALIVADLNLQKSKPMDPLPPLPLSSIAPVCTPSDWHLGMTRPGLLAILANTAQREAK
jgi:hypothetical protein